MELFNKDIYSNRRKGIKQKIENGIALFLGNSESPMNYPANGYHFRQDSNFLYFFGLDIPGLAGVIDIDENLEIIFGNDVDVEDIIWMGPQPLLVDLASKVGVGIHKPFSQLGEYLNNAISKGRKVHFLPPYRADNKILLQSLCSIPFAEMKTQASEALIKAVVDLRAKKDQFEIAQIEKAAAIGFDMHMAAFKMAKPGLLEREIAGVMEGIAHTYGFGPSFPIILSIRGETLHNHSHDNIMKDGDLLLSDAGAESLMHYASDFTRTMPVSGKFSQKQREIYQIVVDANNTAASMVKPGITYQSVHLAAAKVIASGLRDIGLMKGDIDEAVALGAHAMFFPHGLGHMMGLDVHDMEDLGENYVGYDEAVKRSDLFGTAYLRMGRMLKEGYVMTDEPGIYFIPALIDEWRTNHKFEQFINYQVVESYRDFGGIRLEDDILVTAAGGRFIGKRLPITIEEVETVMQKQ